MKLAVRLSKQRSLIKELLAHTPLKPLPLLFLTVLSAANLAAAPPASLRPFLQAHCYDCHDAEVQKGGLDLESLAAESGDAQTLATWTLVHDKVSSGEMPPKKRTAPPVAEKASFMQGLAPVLEQWDLALKGRVLRRLNRIEYEHTLQDLLGVHTELKGLLPEDGKAQGFDTVSEALDLSPVHLQRYMEAAKAALLDAVKWGPAPEKRRVTAAFDGDRNASNVGKHWHKLEDGSLVFFGNGGFPSIIPEFTAPVEGRYRLVIAGRAYQTEEEVTFALYAGTFGRDNDSRSLGVLAMPATGASHTLEVHLRQREKVRFFPQLSPDFPVLQKQGPAAYPGAGLALQPVEIEGPLIDDWPGRGHRLLFGDLKTSEPEQGKGKGKAARSGVRLGDFVSLQPEEDARRLLSQFVPLAFRRPVTAEQLEPYLQLAMEESAAGASFFEAMLTSYIAVLCSPDFLFLREPAGRLDDFALAARLSYLLWSSGPDEELLRMAAAGRLSQPDGLRAQTERLLKDARAARFTTHFTGQWLNLREIDFTLPDKQLYPEYNDTLKLASLQETELFFDEILRGNLSVANFVESDWTMLNEPLAKLYGIPGVKGVAFRRVALRPEHHRGGVMTHASVLKVSANGTTTSPVVRGIWVLERILGVHPSPPPPGVPGVEPDIRGAETLRQLLEKHRNLESCNGCHRVIDPPGFALEHYDVIGGWRENYRSLGKEFPKPKVLPVGVRNVQWRVGPAVDASGQTPEGHTFQNLTEYKKLILAEPSRFTRALAEKLAVYGSGRGMGFSDRSELARITDTVVRKGNGFRDLLHEVVQSAIFLNK